MKKRNYFIFSIILFLFLNIYGASGEITNILVNQRTDGSQLVDIYYDLSGDGTSYFVTIKLSLDNGMYADINNTSGDIGSKIETGFGKHIVWDVGSEFPDTYSSQAKIQITATVSDVEWITVPSGEFTFGQSDLIEQINYDYQIMKYEVTNAQYLMFLKESLTNGKISVTENSITGNYNSEVKEFYNLDGNISGGNLGKIIWDGSTFSIDNEYKNHPVILVTWYGANAFAEFYEYKLPTEQEWEKAARGITGYNFPWGEILETDRANSWESGDPFDNGTTPVGFYNGTNYDGYQTTDGPSPYGTYDQVGNVWEWTNSFYSASERVIKGGAWNSNTPHLRSWFQYYNNTDGKTNIGFRCIKTE